MPLQLILLKNMEIGQMTYSQLRSRFCSQLCHKKAYYLPIEPDEIKSYTVLVSSIDDVKLNPNIVALKNELGEMWKCIRPYVICFWKVWKPKSPEEHYLRLTVKRRNENELKQDNQSYVDRYKVVEGDILCNIKKYRPYLDIDYEEVRNLEFFQLDEEDNAEFSMNQF